MLSGHEFTTEIPPIRHDLAACSCSNEGEPSERLNKPIALAPFAKEIIMSVNQNEVLPASARDTKHFSVVVADEAIRDPRRVQVGGVIKALPVSQPDEATRDGGRVQFGGVLRKSR
jgi:hypothetical protein